MSQFPDKFPESLRQLFDAIEGGKEVAEPPGVQPTGTVEELSDSGDAGSDVARTNQILARIVDLLEQMPTAIWDEVEGR